MCRGPLCALHTEPKTFAAHFNLQLSVTKCEYAGVSAFTGSILPVETVGLQSSLSIPGKSRRKMALVFILQGHLLQITVYICVFPRSGPTTA